MIWTGNDNVDRFITQTNSNITSSLRLIKSAKVDGIISVIFKTRCWHIDGSSGLSRCYLVFSCSYCCNRHLCYDRGRLGRVKIPAPSDWPYFLPSVRVSTCAFASKIFACPKETPSLQASFGVLPRLWLLLCTNPGFETGVWAIRKWPIWKTFAIFDKMMFIVQAIAGRMDGNREAIGDEVALAQRFL